MPWKLPRFRRRKQRAAPRPRTLLVEPIEARCLMATFVVNSTNDSGSGSLRQAILDANATTAADTINFSISSAPRTISLNSELPAITNPVTINGASQSDYVDVPIIELDGTNAGTTASGLTLTANNSTVRSLVINRFGGRGILIQGSGNVIEGNFIGTNLAGSATQGNLGHGIEILNGSNNRIGGVMATCTPPFICSSPFVRNVISGNALDGIFINATGTITASANLIQGNYIGTSASGSVALGNRHGINFGARAANGSVGGSATGEENVLSGNLNAGVAFTAATATNNVVTGNYIGTNPTGTAPVRNVRGVLLQGAALNFIGGTAPGRRNVISGNSLYGIEIIDTGSVVEGNLIGTTVSGTTALPNLFDGIRISGSGGARIGGPAAGAGNTIAFNGGVGVNVIGAAAVQNTIRGNSIHSNLALGIDLNDNGVTLNDTLDTDTGPNALQNFPVITEATSTNFSSSISGSLNSAQRASFTLDFYFSPSADPSGYGEGRNYLGSQIVTTGSAGDATFTVNFATSVPAGNVVTATATDGLGNTSEFSLARAIDFNANSPPTDIAISNSTIPENTNTTNPVLVGNLTAFDPDPGNTHTFALVAGAGSTDNGFFQITGVRLELRAGTVLDHETKPFYQVRLSATDQGGLSVQESFIINVLNVNETPTLAAIANPAAILEDSGQQTVALSGISAGAGESQVLTVTATSSNTTLIPAVAVSYTSPSATGSLSYTPVANQSGTAVITVTVRDNGGTASGGIDTITRQFTVTVTPVNDAPTLDPITISAPIFEDAGPQTITLRGISAGPSETQTLTFIPTSNNPGLITNLTVNYLAPSATGSLNFTPAANQTGTAVITVVMRDDGGTASGGVDSVTRTVSVSIAPVNDPPTLDVIPNSTILEDAPQQTLTLTGISGGQNESPFVAVSATSSNTALIPQPTINYSSGSSIGSLFYQPVANQSGTAQITVTLQDSGGTANGGNDTFQRTFTVTVLSVNDAPTLNPIANPAAILEESGLQTIPLSGISAGANEPQTLSITATSNNPSLIPNPLVTYTSPNTTGSLSYTPAANRSGTAVITVTVRDNGGTQNTGVDTFVRTFSVSVTGVNDPPTLDLIPSPQPIAVNAASQSINLSGITAGSGESQVLTVTATSSNPGLIPNPAVTYTSPNSTGSLSYQPLAGQRGSALITVRVMDDGGTANGGSNVFERSFCASVRAGNENVAPCFSKGPDLSVTDESGPQSISAWAGAITPGAADEAGQTLVFEVVADDPSLFAAQPQINAAGTLTFTPAPNVQGTTLVTVTLKDNGGTAGGGSDTSAPQQFRITITKPHPWHNTRNPRDVNDSRGTTPVSALDALIVFNALNAFPASLPAGSANQNGNFVVLPTATTPTGPSLAVPPFFYDVNKDNFISAIDALLVINFLNAGGTAEGEGEAASGETQADAYFAELGSAADDSGDFTSLLTDDEIGIPVRRRSRLDAR